MSEGGFSERFVASLKAPDGAAQSDFFETDPKYRGLCLRVSRSGRKVWCFLFQWSGKRARATLGTYPAITVKEAHRLAIEARGHVDSGRDPRREMRARDASAMTVADLAESFLMLEVRAPRKRKSDGVVEPGLRNARKIEGTLRRHVLPVIGSVTLADLAVRDVNRVLDPIRRRGHMVAHARTFQIIRRMCNWAVSRGDLDRAPTDRMEKPEQSDPRDRALSEDEIRLFWRDLHKAIPIVSVQRALKLQLLLGQRVGEVCGMRKTELDLRAPAWNIPAERSKNKYPHTVPLPPLAMETIEEALADAGDSAFVFPDPKTGGAFTSTAVATMIVGAHAKIGIEHFTSHDLRRTCSNVMDELGVMDTIISRILNHRHAFKKNVTQRHYVTRSYEKEKRDALELYESRLRGIIGGEHTAEIIPLRA